MRPEDCRYTKEHEWVFMEGEIATVGITDYAQSQLGDVVYIEMQEVGSTLEQFKPFGIVESVKAVSDLYSPLSGEVVAVNEALYEQPELINEEPFEGGWMMKVRLTDPAELGKLMALAQYEEFIASLEEE